VGGLGRSEDENFKRTFESQLNVRLSVIRKG